MHAADVGGCITVIPHPAKCLHRCVISRSMDRVGVAGIGNGTTGEEVVVGEVLLTHANTLADEVVLVSLQLALHLCQLPHVLFVLLCRPGGVDWAAIDLAEFVVNLDVLAAFGGADGEVHRWSRE